MRRRDGILLALGLLLSGCGGGGGTADPAPTPGPGPVPTGRIEGRVDYELTTDAHHLETEPNDTFDEAGFVAEIRPGQRVNVLGQMDATADPVDGFRFRAPTRMRITATLVHQSPATNAFDLVVYDPVALQIVEESPAGTSPRVHVFHAKGSFDVALRAVAGGGAYELTLEASPAPDPVGEREPNDVAASAHYLGELLREDRVRVAGNGMFAAAPDDYVLVVCPEAVRVNVSLDHAAPTDFDLHVGDATSDPADPSPLLDLDGSTVGPVTGEVDVPPGTVLLIDVRAVAGEGPWLLDISAEAPADATKRAVVRHVARIAKRSTETRRIRPGARGDAPAYLRVRRAIAPGEALIAFEDGNRGAEGLAGRGASLATRAERGVRRLALHLPSGLDAEDEARSTLARIRALAGVRGVRYVEPNRLRRAQTEPNDAYYGFQWHYDQIKLPQAWERTTGDPNVIVAVVDTGRTDHPDLAGRQVGGYDFVSTPWMARDGDGMDPDPTDPGDLSNGSSSSFHGTHVAGTVGAATDNGLGVAGVTWSGAIMHCRVLGRGGGTDFDVAQGILYAARLPNASGALPPVRANVVNMSLGGPGFSQTLADACAAARSAGVTLVAAAGNSSTSTPSYPAANAGVISVMGVDASQLPAWYTNTGSTVDLAAPGGNLGADVTGDGYADGVLSTIYDDTQSPAVPAFGFYQGTSMAAPHVAGVAALVISIDPTLSPTEVEDILTSTAQDLGLSGRDDTFGHGLVDAYAAVIEAEGGAAPGLPELGLFPSKLNFGSGSTVLFAEIRNLGGLPLEVTDVEAETSSGGPWLTAEIEGAGDATRSASRVRIRVERVALPGGIYLGTVRVYSDGGVVELSVAMQKITELPPRPNVTFFVQAVRVDTGQVLQTAEVNPVSTLRYSFPTLPIGSYVIRAFSDIDGDGALGEAEDFQGAYPLLSEPTVLTLLKNQAISNVDFRVRVPEGFGALGLTR